MRKREKEDELIVVLLFMQLVYKCLGHLLPKIEPSLFFIFNIISNANLFVKINPRECITEWSTACWRAAIRTDVCAKCSVFNPVFVFLSFQQLVAAKTKYHYID